MADLKTCFKRVDYDLSNLLLYIDLGDIGLPDIQRPFVDSSRSRFSARARIPFKPFNFTGNTYQTCWADAGGSQPRASEYSGRALNGNSNC